MCPGFSAEPSSLVCGALQLNAFGGFVFVIAFSVGDFCPSVLSSPPEALSNRLFASSDARKIDEWVALSSSWQPVSSVSADINIKNGRQANRLGPFHWEEDRQRVSFFIAISMELSR